MSILNDEDLCSIVLARLFKEFSKKFGKPTDGDINELEKIIMFLIKQKLVNDYYLVNFDEAQEEK